jgi:ketosteroid isomerase-like protein
MNDNLATVSAIYAAFGNGDIPGILSRLADDVCFEDWADNSAQKAGVPWFQPRSGKAGVLEFFEVVATYHQIKEFRVLALMAGGNQVVAEIVTEADIPPTGGNYRDEELHLWTFDDNGKVVRLRHYTDTAKHIAVALDRA